MAQRQYEACTVFNSRIVDMRHLWEPSREYKGQATQKPNWFAMFIVPKTQHQWFAEPVFAGVAAACMKFNGIMQMYNYNPGSVVWPIVDGDMPSPDGKSSDFAKGHWLFSGSSSNAINVELAQAGGALVKLPGKAGVKSGDFTMTGLSAAIAQNQANRIKFYLNAVVFTAPGEEIVFANSVSGSELMRMAQQQGLQVAGFAPSAGGFGTPQGGFAPNPGQFAPAPGGFAPQPGQFGGAPGFTPAPGGFAPMTGGPVMQHAPGQFQAPAGGFGTPPQTGPAGPGQFQPAPTNGNAVFPSNPGQQFPGGPAPGGWPQR